MTIEWWSPRGRRKRIEERNKSRPQSCSESPRERTFFVGCPAVLYQFCSFIFNMGLTPPPFLNNVKKKRLVQRGAPNNHLKQSRISMLIWQCFTHQRILILILHCNSAPKRGMTNLSYSLPIELLAMTIAMENINENL